jgi:hypothetical protein
MHYRTHGSTFSNRALKKVVENFPAGFKKLFLRRLHSLLSRNFKKWADCIDWTDCPYFGGKCPGGKLVGGVGEVGEPRLEIIFFS